MKKLFPILMSILCVFCFTFVGFAFLPKDDAPTGGTPEVSAKYSGGGGTSDDPYLISSEDDFAVLYEDMSNSGMTSGNYYLQTCNIDLSSYISSYGVYGIFEGFYNGGGFEVYIGNQNFSVENYVGLFPAVYSATVCNLIVKGGWTCSNANSGLYGVGGVVGFADSSIISRCAFEGAVYGASDYASVGGIAGFTYDSTFSECVFRGQIATDPGYTFGGGIVGASYSISQESISDGNTYIHSCLAVGEAYSFRYAGGIMGVTTAEKISGCVSEMYNAACEFMGNIIGMNCFLDSAVGENEDNSVPCTCDITYCVSVYDGPIFVFGIDVCITECWYTWDEYTDMPYDPDFNDYWGYTTADFSSYWSGLYNEPEGYDYFDYVENHVLCSASGDYGYPLYWHWFHGEVSAIDEQYFGSSGFQGFYDAIELLPDTSYTFYSNIVRSDWYYSYLVEDITIQSSGYAVPMLTWYEALYVFLWDSDGNFVECGHLADYTDNYEDMSDYEQGGDYSNAVKLKPLWMYMDVYVCPLGGSSYSSKAGTISGLSVTFSYLHYETGASETHRLNGYGWVGHYTIMPNENITVVVSVDGYICTGIWLEDETVSTTSEVTSRTVNPGYGDEYDDYYRRDIKIYLRQISNNKLNSYYFSDGTFPQTAVVTYNTAFNTLLTNRCDEKTYFDSNGKRFYIMTYTYSSSDDKTYAAYSGQKFLGFEYTSATKTIKLKNREGTLTNCTFTNGTTYWFKFEPIRWRITDYDSTASDLPEDFDEFGEGQIDFSVVTDVLWWDVMNDDSTNKLGVGDTAMQTTFMQNLSNGTLFGGGFGLTYSNDRVISVDEWNLSSTNLKKTSTKATFSPDQAGKVVSARYLRISGTGNNENSSNFVNKLSVVNSSGTETVLIDANSSSTISYTTTGLGTWLDYSSFGKSCYNYTQTFTIDMGSSKSIAGVYLRRYWTSARIYYGTKIEFSTDGTNWKTYWDSGNNGAYGSHDATEAYVETENGMWFYLPTNAWVASIEEISKYQSELGCYGSQLACVLAGKGQDQFLEYWTRDFGHSVGCGTYVTSSGVVMRNSYYASKAKGIRFAITMSEGSNLG